MMNPSELRANGAACHSTNPELFFSDRTADITQAKAVCSGCPVRAECLDRALRLPELFGIFGGMTSKERVALRRTRTDLPSVPGFRSAEERGSSDGKRYSWTRSRYNTLTDADVTTIRAELAQGVRGSDLARRFGVSQSYVARIKSGTRR